MTPKRFAGMAVLLGVVVLNLWWLAASKPGVATLEHSPGDLSPAATDEKADMVNLVAVSGAPTTERRSGLDEVAASTTKRRLKGRVLKPDGSSAANALVALIKTRNGAPVRHGQNATTKTDRSGEFELKVPDWALGERVLVSARKQGLRPSSSIEVLDTRYLEEKQVLLLGIGFAISGRVMRDGLPVSGADVKLGVPMGATGIYGAGWVSSWAEGRVEESHGRARTAEDGSFQINGLSPVEHHLVISEKKAPSRRISSSVYAVTAPDSRTYDLSSATLRITVQGQAGPIENAKVTVSAMGGRVKLLSGLTPQEAEVPPLAEIKIKASHPGITSVEETVMSPAAGQALDVFLDVQYVERTRLIVELPGATAAGIERVVLRFVSDRREATGLKAYATGQTDTYVAEVVPLEEGRYKVLLDPSGGKDSEAFINPMQQSVELPKSGDVHLKYLLSFAGRCEVNLHSPIRHAWSAKYELRDAAGEVRMSRTVNQFEGEAQDSVFAVSRDSSGASPFGGASEWAKICEVLPPGEYTVEVTSKEHETWTGKVTIVAGEKAKVRVDLKRKQ